jgi:hypothetical protein
MKLLRFSMLCGLTVILSGGLILNCGKKGPSYDERIQTLTEKGTPDSILADVKVYLYQYNSAKKFSQAGNIRRYKDSLKIGLAAAEGWFEEQMQKSAPIIAEQKKKLEEQKAQLSGLPLKDADSMMAVADSLMEINWLLAARTKYDKIAEVMPILLKNEETAKELRPKLIGTWKDVHTLVPPEDSGLRFRAVDKRVFKFSKDGSFWSSEERKGQTTEFLKEDWKFISWGKFDLVGDTIYQFIEREECVKQIYTQKNVKLNKWESKANPTYDSTITNGRKDRFIVYSDLKLEFKKIR